MTAVHFISGFYIKLFSLYFYPPHKNSILVEFIDQHKDPKRLTQTLPIFAIHLKIRLKRKHFLEQQHDAVFTFVAMVAACPQAGCCYNITFHFYVKDTGIRNPKQLHSACYLSKFLFVASPYICEKRDNRSSSN